MGKSQCLRLRDLRELYLLLGECCEVGRRPIDWQSHLLSGINRILGARVGLCGMTIYANGECKPGDVYVMVGSDAEQAARSHRQYLEQRMEERDLYPQIHLRLPGDIVTSTWDQLLTREQWYNSEAFNDCYRPAGMDHLMVSRCATGAGEMHTIFLQRALGESAFEARHRRLLHLLHRELRRMLGGKLTMSPRSCGVAHLSPRLRQVLALLMEGHGEKQVADLLNLSTGTVHEYAKSLHRCFGVNSRGELLARAWRLYGDPDLWDDVPRDSLAVVSRLENPSTYRP